MDTKVMSTNEQALFQPILDANEQIVKTLRPQRGRAWFTTIILLVLLTIFLVPLALSFIVFNDTMDPEGETLGLGITLLVALILIVIVTVVNVILWCKKTVYALTNKRILIRTGHIGVDYKSLDYQMVGALTVNVNVLDKLYRKNTGSIAFGSMASPMVANNAAKFNFIYVRQPYDVYQEVKAYIDEKRQKN